MDEIDTRLDRALITDFAAVLDKATWDVVTEIAATTTLTRSERQMVSDMVSRKGLASLAVAISALRVFVTRHVSLREAVRLLHERDWGM